MPASTLGDVEGWTLGCGEQESMQPVRRPIAVSRKEGFASLRSLNPDF